MRKTVISLTVAVFGLVSTFTLLPSGSDETILRVAVQVGGATF